MVRILCSDRKCHVIDNAFCTDECTEYKIGTMLCFAKHVRDAVDSACPGLAAHDAYYDAVACGLLLIHFLSLPGWKDATIGQLAQA